MKTRETVARQAMNGVRVIFLCPAVTTKNHKDTAPDRHLICAADYTSVARPMPTVILLVLIMFLLVPSRAFFVHPSRITSCRSMLFSMSAAEGLVGKTLVTVGEALNAFEDPSVIFVDGSWFLSGRNGRAEFEAGPRIQGAVYFDVDDVASKGDLNPRSLKHMMPPKRLFAAAMDAMGIQNSNHLIVYGTQGCVSRYVD